MKRCLFLLIISLVSIQANALSGLPTIPSWPNDHINDEVGLFPFGEEVKFNFFLEEVLVKEKLYFHFELIPSLEGLDIEEKSQIIMDRLLQDHQEVLLFTLSLSDRNFKIMKSSLVPLTDDDLNELVKVTLPSLKAQNYANAIRIFLQNTLYKLNDQNLFQPPLIGDQKRGNLNILIFFSTFVLFVFFLGHKIRKTAPVKEISPELKKTRSKSIGIFWS